MRDLSRILVSLDERLNRIPRALFVVAVLAFVIVRNGFDFFEFDWAVTSESIRLFPEAVNFASWSWGNLVLAKIFGVQDQSTWYALHAVLTIIALLLPLVLVRNLHGSEFHTFTIFWFLLPVVGSLLMWIGMYDVMTVIGSIIVGLSRRPWQAAVGAVIMSAGNPEQAIVGTFAFLLTVHHSAMRVHRRPAWTAFVVSLIAFIASRMLISAETATDRSGLLRAPLEGLEYLVLNWPSSVWSWNGILWFFVIATIVLSKGRDRVLILASLILIPAIAVFLTYDWARVYWLTTMTSLVALGYTFAKSGLESTFRGGVLALGMISLVIVPPTVGGTFFLISKFGAVLN